MSEYPSSWPLSLHDAAQVRALDARLMAAGTPGAVLMQRAAQAAWRALRRRWPQLRKLCVLAGPGNNGGDGYLLAVLARRAGWDVQVYSLADPARLRDAAAQAYAEACAQGVQVQPWHAEAVLDGLLVDAMLGTGLAGELREPYATAVARINASGLPCLALDIPSGLCADTGRLWGAAVRADLTVTFIALKLGLFTGAGPDQVGELCFADLQADAALCAAAPAMAQRLTAGNLQRLPARPRTTHKGRCGRLLVVGGERGYGGAALLAAQSGLRGGAGMVSLATREEHVAGALARCPELMVRGLLSSGQLLALLPGHDVLVVGPGLGQGAWGRSLLTAAAQFEGAQVWDADALNLLAAGRVQIRAGAVLTPHPGEAARLLGCSLVEVQDDRPAAALRLAQRYQAVVVLKGAGSLVTDGHALRLCEHGHPAMAGPGLGDVLAGLIGALLAQGLAALPASELAVWLHARAGERLGQAGRGLLASELVGVIRELLEEHSPCCN
ncbi:bifunctional ADP-dependent NAD(P)H-hydrate dehydratase/NAD(P)H-hydrate epimerase [Pseudomonas fluvialis]|uniref:Bifunctional NAD(P)H-hydrate repair enzyme n=1 Tax=Pseudomonas fluvialis TaxID=1793966 RepID=A0ABQ2AES8_9PSED|nr:NAD(P)H-hydrate dehydratase [Pseudomonas fluvialis]OXM41725.1 bifunctional ADP-dependent NAD(P)H-hydrate dehydratase/NAD(P)H-hydrate epimerase [Pseudomonas fluvialis]GGH89629.1 bifunctional NAD(P)H-hydrate repair enzyme [Pseudomonas fluvialis]